MSIYYRLLTLSELGHTIDLVTYHVGHDVSLKGLRTVRLPAIPFIRSVKAGPSIAKIILDGFLLIKTIAMVARRKTDYDLVFAHEEGVAMALILKKLFHLPVIYDMHSSLPRQFENFKYANVRFIKRAFSALEKTALTRSACVLTICDDLEQLARSRGARRTVLLPNVRFDSIQYAGQHQPDETGVLKTIDIFLQKNDKEKVLFYSGTFEPYQGIPLMLKAFHLVRKNRQDVKLLMIGGHIPRIKAAKRHLAAPDDAANVLFTGTISPNTVGKLIKQADLLLSTRIKGTNTPLKIYSYLASGVPLVATAIPAHTQEFGGNEAFLAAPDPEGIAEAILTGLDHPELARDKAQNARHLYETRYGTDVYRKKMVEALSVLHQRPADTLT